MPLNKYWSTYNFIILFPGEWRCSLPLEAQKFHLLLQDTVPVVVKFERKRLHQHWYRIRIVSVINITGILLFLYQTGSIF